MKEIFYRRIVCEYESKEGNMRLYAYEKRTPLEVLEVILLIPIAWVLSGLEEML